MAGGQTAASLMVNIGADLSGLNSGMSSASNSLSTFGKGIAVAGAAVGGAFVVGMGKGIKSAGDLQQAVANVSSIKPSIDTSQVTNALLDISTKVPQSAQELADGLYNIFSSVNVSQAQALSLVQTFAEGATAAGTDTATWGTSVMGVMNAYGMSVEEASHISDVFFNTIADGVVTGPELAASLGPVTQSALAAGVSLDELGAMVVGVTKAGGPASQNINNLNNTLSKITTEKAQDALHGLGIATVDATGKFRPVMDVMADLKTSLEGMTEAGRANAMQEIFPDAQARQGAMALMAQSDAVNAALEKNRSGADSTAAAFKIMSGTFNSQMKLLSNSFISVLTKIGTAVLPLITPLVIALSDAIPKAFDKASAAAVKLEPALQSAGRGIQNIGSLLSGDMSLGSFAAILQNKIGEGITAAIAGIESIAKSAGKKILSSLSDGARESIESILRPLTEDAGSFVLDSLLSTVKSKSASAGILAAMLGDPEKQARSSALKFAVAMAQMPKLTLALPTLDGNAAVASAASVGKRIGASLTAAMAAGAKVEEAATDIAFRFVSSLAIGIAKAPPIPLPKMAGGGDTSAATGKLAEGIAGASEPLSQFAATFALVLGGLVTAAPLLAAVGAGISGIGAVAGLVGGVIGAGLLAPIVLIAAAAAALYVAWSNNFLGIQDTVNAVIPVVLGLIQSLPDTINGIVQAIMPTLQQFSDAFSVGFANAGPALAGVGEALAAFGAQIAPILGPIAANFLTLVPLVEQLAAAYLNLVQGALAQLPGILTALGPLIQSIGNVIVAVAPVIGQVLVFAIGALITSLTFLVNVISAALPTAQAIFVGVVGVITALLNSLSEVITAVVATVTALLAGDWAGAWNGAQAVFVAVMNMIQSVSAAIFAAVLGIITAFLASTQSIWGPAWNTVLATLQTVMTSINEAVTTATTTIQNTINTALGLVKSTWDTGWNALTGLLSSAWSAIQGALDGAITGIQNAITQAMSTIQSNWTSAWNELIAPVSTALTSVVSTISGFAGQAYSAAYTIGTQAVQGLINGIDALIGAARAKVQELAQLVIQAASAAIGVHSPSTVFYAIGQNIGQGLVNGIEASFPAIATAASNMADVVTGGGIGSSIADAVTRATAGAPGETNSATIGQQDQGAAPGIGSLGPDLVEPMIAAWTLITQTINTAIATIVQTNTPLLLSFLNSWLTLFSRIRVEGIAVVLDLLTKSWPVVWSGAAKVVEVAGLRIIKIVDEVARHIQRLLQLIARLPGGVPAPRVNLGSPIGGDFGDINGAPNPNSVAPVTNNTFNNNVQNANVDADQLMRILERQLRLAGSGVV